jgi:hypothetical protein
MPKEALGARVVSDPTASLLWEACRPEPDVDAINALGSVQVPLVMGLAVANRIAPMLWRTLKVAQREDVLGDEWAHLQEMADVYRMQGQLLYPQVVARAVRPLTDTGLEPVIMKGPAVAIRYPEAGLRPMDDIDLLLPRAYHAPALRALRAAGWEVSDERPNDTLFDTLLRHPELPNVPLELHYGLEPPFERSNSLDPIWLWERRIPIDCLGTPAFGLPVEEEIVALAAHAGRPYHRFERLIWLADIAMVIDHAHAHGGLDWRRVETVANSTQCTTVVGTALQMTRRLGVSPPAGMFALPDRGWRASVLSPLFDMRWPLEVSGGRFRVRFALVDSPWRRIALVVGDAYYQSWRQRLGWAGRLMKGWVLALVGWRRENQV